MTKYVLVIPDGMGDKPLAKLGGRTPLEAAHTPVMDFFASRGIVGLSQNIPDGFIPGTDVGCMSVFGYDPTKYFTGRGPLEAAELGIELKSDELAFRCNLVTLEGPELKDFSADHISVGEARKLLESFDAEVRKKYGMEVRFYPGKGTGYRNLMVLKGAHPGMQETLCTPPHDIMGRPYARHLPKGQGAELLMALMESSKNFFEDHLVNRKRRQMGKGTANMIWLWGQGFPPCFPSYHESYGFQGAVISAVDLIKGIALYAGLDVIRVPGVTGYFDTNYVGKAEYAVNSLRSRDFVAIHIESTDEAGHIGDPDLKIKAIEDVDRLLLGTLKRGLEEFGDYKILLMPDHFTCVETKTHSSDPVPFFIYSRRDEKKGPAKFSERSGAASGLIAQEGYRLMDFFVKGVDCFSVGARHA